MAKLISLKCPECGANLSVETELKHFFCQYCGAKIMLEDDSATYTYRKVDEARIKEAEVSEIIKLKELEIEERKRITEERHKSNKVKISIILGIIGAILIAIGYLGGENSGNPDSPLYIFALIGFFCISAILYIWIL